MMGVTYMKYSDVIKFVVYFLLFALILYIEKSMIDMQTGSCIDDKDRSGGIGFVAVMGLACILPFYLLYDLVVHKLIYRLLALLLQAFFCLWSLRWFERLVSLRHTMQYENVVTSNGMMPVDENNFYDCWTIGYGIMIYLTLAMIISYIWKQYSINKRQAA